jgi:hypothetical protein
LDHIEPSFFDIQGMYLHLIGQMESKSESKSSAKRNLVGKTANGSGGRKVGSEWRSEHARGFMSVRTQAAGGSIVQELM